jgi:pimeloyl-ACP methyl ester carboxylesterase
MTQRETEGGSRIDPARPDLDDIAGVAHEPEGAPRGVVVLTHGAGGSRESPLLVALCDEWARRGWLAIRYNLPYRRRRPKGPPSGSSGTDQAGIAEALAAARGWCDGPVIAGGHSYGGRLTSMLVAEQPGIADELTLFSYPLHPPGRPDRLRTEHDRRAHRLHPREFGSVRITGRVTSCGHPHSRPHRDRRDHRRATRPAEHRHRRPGTGRRCCVDARRKTR